MFHSGRNLYSKHLLDAHMNVMRNRILISLAALTATAFSSAQLGYSWQRHYNGPASLDDSTYNLVTDAQGNIYQVGTVNGTLTTADIGIVKYDRNGNLLWSTTYNGTANGQDIGGDIALSLDGSLYVAGSVATPGSGSGSDMVLLKFRQDTGAFVWAQLYDGPMSNVDTASEVEVDAEGNVFLGGRVWNDAEFFSNADYCTAKYDPEGTLLWATLYDGPATYVAISDSMTGMVVDANGDVFVTGDSPGSGNISDYATVKYNGQTGAEIWVQRYEGNGQTDVPETIQLAADGDVIVGGKSTNGQSQVAIIRYDGATGAQEWVSEGTFRGSFGLRHCMRVGPNGNIALTTSFDPDFDDSNQNNNLRTVLFDGATGAKLWATDYGTNVHYDMQAPRTVTMDSQGNVIVIAREYMLGVDQHFLMQIYDGATGALAWSQNHFPELPGAIAEARYVGFDPFGSLLFCGNVQSSLTSGIDIFLAKYSQILRPAYISISQSPAWGGTSPTVRVVLTGRPAIGAQDVTITDNSSFVTSPTNVTVAKGALSATFNVSTLNPTYSQSVTITARIGSSTVTKSFMLNKVAVKTLGLALGTVQGGQSTTATVTLNGPAPTGGLYVAITDNSVKVSTPTTVSVPSGSTTATFTVATLPVTASVNATIRAYANGATGTSTLVVTP